MGKTQIDGMEIRMAHFQESGLHFGHLSRVFPGHRGLVGLLRGSHGSRVWRRVCCKWRKQLQDCPGQGEITQDKKTLCLNANIFCFQQVTDVRLPRHLIPIKYNVKLIPFIIPDNFTIDGSVSIIMEALETGSNVTLHSADMDIDHGTVRVNQVTENGQNVAEIRVNDHEYDEDREFYITHLSGQLEVGKFYEIRMDFTAKLNDNLKGFYRSVYKNKQTNEQEYIAVTQFQPTDARRAFPCFDEPAIKAKFEVSLGRLKEMTSISNMPIVKQGVEMDNNRDYVWDHYEESVPMSTYLVAFVVSRFGFEISPDSGNNVQFRIWARKDALDQIAYAKDIGPKILKFFETYFNVDYPLPKQVLFLPWIAHFWVVWLDW